MATTLPAQLFLIAGIRQKEQLRGRDYFERPTITFAVVVWPVFSEPTAT